MAKNKDTPIVATFAQTLSTAAGINDAALRDVQRQEIPPAEMPYNSATDQGLASRRSKTVMRTHAEIAAARTGDPALDSGMSLRQAMAGQCENDQFIYCTDRYGKQRS